MYNGQFKTILRKKLVLSSTVKIMSEITNSTYMDAIVDDIVNNKEAQFDQKIVNKIMNNVVPKVSEEAKVQLRQSFISEINSIKKTRSNTGENKSNQLALGLIKCS